MMSYTPEMRRLISEEIKGKTVESLEWTDSNGGYWTMTFTDGSEISFRFMTE